MSVFSKIFGALNQDLPLFNNLDEGVDFLMNYLFRFSEELWDEEFYTEIRWLEIRDDVHFQESILHVFKEDGQYLRILDGDISSGVWENELGGIILKINGRHELYERTFLNEEFFILKKHGDHSIKGLASKYFFLTREPLGKRYEWPQLLSILYAVYQSNTHFRIIVFVLVALLFIVLFFTLF